MFSSAFLTEPTPDQISAITGLYRAEGWWEGKADDPERVAKIVTGSHGFLVVTIDDKIIAMGRAISDGSSDAYIQDVTVETRYRGQGIGTEIIRRLVRRLNGDGLEWIGLIAEKNSHLFYERLGFLPMRDSVPMLKMKNET